LFFLLLEHVEPENKGGKEKIGSEAASGAINEKAGNKAPQIDSFR